VQHGCEASACVVHKLRVVCIQRQDLPLDLYTEDTCNGKEHASREPAAGGGGIAAGSKLAHLAHR